MQTLEYKLIRYEIADKSHEQIDKIVEDILNKYAKEGWRLHESGFGLIVSNVLLLYRPKGARTKR